MNIITNILMFGLTIITLSNITCLMEGDYPRIVQVDIWMDTVYLIIGVVIITCFLMIKGEK